MDIRRKTTYLSRNSVQRSNVDGRQGHSYSSYFQSAQKKHYNADPESGMHSVGPMFELTACVERKGDEEDFDAIYPESSVSYGPSICSFGLKYNDHNYALPSGLTPPTMAPHLMDSHSRNARSDNTCSRAIFSDDIGRQNRFSSLAEDTGVVADANPRTPTEASGGTTSDSGADPKSRLLDTWASMSSAGAIDSVTRAETGTSDHGYRNFEQMEMRYEPELKVIEVPEELAVSPSQLSDLDSNASDDEFATNKVALSGSSVRAVVLDGDLINGSNWPLVRCICGQAHIKIKLIRCPSCMTCQHVHCMEVQYCVSLPRLCEGYVCLQCGTEEPNATAPDQSESLPTRPSTIPNLLDPISEGNNEDPKAAFPNQEDDSSNLSLGTSDVTKRMSINEGVYGAQYVEATVDRAKRLGLLSKVDIPKSTAPNQQSGRTNDGRVVDWERLNELSRSSRRPIGDTNVNLRVPSPPRASKRKQDLTSTVNEQDVNAPSGGSEKRVCAPGSLAGCIDDTSSASMTPTSTPTSTPYKLRTPGTPSTPGRTLTPGSEYSSSSGLDSPYYSNDQRRGKPGRALFADSSISKRARTNPLGAAWAKDYHEADSNIYTPALLEYVEQRLSSNFERNYRIPPSYLTRSSLCRVVLFDHDDKGLEASIRLAVNEVATEVRGKYLLLDEYEHYVDPISEYNRYVLLYRGFGDRAIVINSTQYGNNARFIRRSCVPNCHLEHCIVQDKLQMVIRTTNEILPGTELTIPFDFDYRACRYPLDCACARSRCPVLKWGRKLSRNKVVPNLDYSKYIETQLRVLSKTYSQESPAGRGSPYDPMNLTGSPIMRGSTGSGSFSVRPHSLSSPVPMKQYDRIDRFGPSKPNSPDIGKCSSMEGQRPTTNLPSPDTPDVIDAEARLISDENERPGAVQETSLHSTSAGASSVPQTKVVHEKLSFEPIITTRRQAAAMRST